MRLRCRAHIRVKDFGQTILPLSIAVEAFPYRGRWAIERGAEGEGLPIINITGEKVMLGPLERETCIALEYRSLNDFATLRSRWEAAPVPATTERAIRMYDLQVADNDGAYFLIYERATAE